MEAGREVARHYAITHGYWREGGPEFHDVNVMAVAHGTEKANVLANKAAIDTHLREAGIEFTYTNVFWGGRSEIKPSEIAPDAYREFCRSHGIDPDTMLAESTARKELRPEKKFCSVARRSDGGGFARRVQQNRRRRHRDRRAPFVDAARRL